MATNIQSAAKGLLPFALLAVAALCPAPINDAKRAPKPVPERSQAQLLKEMKFNGAYKPVGKVPKKTEETPQREAPKPRDNGSVAAASAGIVKDSGAAITQVTQKVEGDKNAFRIPAWLLLALAGGGAFGIVRGLRAWADKALPTPRRS